MGDGHEGFLSESRRRLARLARSSTDSSLYTEENVFLHAALRKVSGKASTRVTTHMLARVARMLGGTWKSGSFVNPPFHSARTGSEHGKRDAPPTIADVHQEFASALARVELSCPEEAESILFLRLSGAFIDGTASALTVGRWRALRGDDEDCVAFWLVYLTKFLKFACRSTHHDALMVSLSLPVFTYMELICYGLFAAPVSTLLAMMPYIASVENLCPQCLSDVGRILLVMAGSIRSGSSTLQWRMPCLGEMDDLRKSVLYVDYAATLRAASLMEARCNSTISAERRFDIVVGLKRGLDPSMVVEYMEKESIEFALQLCSPEFTLQRNALLRSAEPKAIKLLLEWPVLIPAYMYLAQCFHCDEIKCM
jgi:hypothetical protein